MPPNSFFEVHIASPWRSARCCVGLYRTSGRSAPVAVESGWEQVVCSVDADCYTAIRGLDSVL